MQIARDSHNAKLLSTSVGNICCGFNLINSGKRCSFCLKFRGFKFNGSFNVAAKICTILHGEDTKKIFIIYKAKKLSVMYL